MECCKIRDLRSLAAAHGISLHGLLEKHEIVKALRLALPDHVMFEWLHGLERGEAVSVASMVIPVQAPSQQDEGQQITRG